MKKPFLEVGQIVGTHGIAGELRVQPWCDTPDFLCGFSKLYLDDAGGKQVDIISSRAHKNIVLMRIEGVGGIEDAERLRGKTLYISRQDAPLEEGANFICDLLGCAVFDADSGDRLGTLTDVIKTGANDVWQVSENGRDYLVPVIPEVLCEVDTDREIVTIRPLKGIFDNDN